MFTDSNSDTLFYPALCSAESSRPLLEIYNTLAATDTRDIWGVRLLDYDYLAFGLLQGDTVLHYIDRVPVAGDFVRAYAAGRQHSLFYFDGMNLVDVAGRRLFAYDPTVTIFGPVILAFRDSPIEEPGEPV